MDLIDRLKRVDEARKKALESEQFHQQVREHAQAIEQECKAPSKSPNKRKKRAKSKNMSDLYSGNSHYPMY